MKVLRVLLCLAGAAGLVSIIVLGIVETTTLGQPTVADGVYRHPAHIKGKVRFLTDRQERIRSIAMWGMFGGLAISIVVLIPYRRQEQRQLAEERKELMDRIDRAFPPQSH